jgi:omega-hydroxy-beta-dihydromenaquinone-9 sulfotransferase
MVFDLQLYLRHFAAAVARAGKQGNRLSVRRFFLLLFLFIFYPLYELLHRAGFLLDRIFFPDFLKREVEAPVFILGNFRSGSTFLQRLLARDRSTFTGIKTWEIYFAPSITQRKLVRLFFQIDRLLGSPIKQRILAFEKRSLKTVEIHHMGFQEEEEDEGLFTHQWTSVLLWFLMPFRDINRPLLAFDENIPEKRRKKLIRWYRHCVQRHMHAHPESAVYFSKSPSFSPKIRSLLEEFPRARFVYLARTPYEVIPSVMNWFTIAWNFFNTPGERYPYPDLVMEMVQRWYHYPLSVLDSLPPDQALILRYDDFVADPESTVIELYRRFGLEMSPAFAARLSAMAKEAKNYWSPNVLSLKADGIDPEEIRHRFAHVFERFGFSAEFREHPDSVE